MSFEGWNGITPPYHWPRILAFDVGGATNNAMEFGAQDPETKSIVMYDEVHKVTTDMRLLASLAIPKTKDLETGAEYNFLFKVVDYENRVAADEIGRHGLRFSNAVKHDKLLSVQRLSGYLHPNPKRPFPSWHPKAGQLGAPLMFITAGCPQLIKEIPIQRWKGAGEGDQIKDEMDRTVKHDCVDAALYIARLLPAPATIPVPKVAFKQTARNIMSRLYWEDVKRMKEKAAQTESRRKYNPAHQGGLPWQLQR